MLRLFTRRRITVSAIVAISIVGLAALVTTVALRLGYLESYLLSRVQMKLAGYGARVEIGSMKPSLRDLSVEAHDLRFYVQGAREPFATINTLAVSVTLREFLGLSGPTEIRVRTCRIEGLRARYEVDENGHSNLDGLHASTLVEQRFTVIYSAAMTTVRDAEFTYLDRLHKLDGTARNLTIALSPVENGEQRLIASSRESEFVYDGRGAKGLDLDLNALVTAHGARVESLAVRSQLLTADLKGELKSWQTFDYQLEAQADFRLRDVGYLFAPDLKLAGSARFEGQVEGSGIDYRVKGKLRGENLVARDVRLNGLNLDASVSGKGADATGRTELAISVLQTAGFVVNRLSAIGDLVSHPAGFSWLGVMRGGGFAAGNVSGKNITVTGARLSGPFDDAARIHLTGNATIGSLITADVPIGSVTSDIAATADEIEFPNFKGAVFGGEAKGRARMRLDGRGQSELVTDLSGLDIDRAMAAALNKRLPLRGKASGRIELRWPGGNYRRADGSIKLDFAGDAVQKDASGVPVNGTLSLTASQGKMRLDDGLLKTGKTELKANGTLGWDRSGDLSVILTASDAAELQRLVEDFSDAVDSDAARTLVGNLHEYEIQLAGGMRFQGRVLGEVNRPQVAGRFALDSVNVGSEQLGQISGDLDYRSDALHLANTKVTQTGGGSAELSLDYPFEVENGASMRARLDNVAIAPLARFFVDAKIAGRVTGNAELAGLPAAMRGTAEVTIDEAQYEGRSIEQVRGRFVLEGTRIDSRDVNLRVAGGAIAGSGWFDTKTKGYSVSLHGEGLNVAELVNSGRDAPIDLTGKVDVKLEAESGLFKRDEKGGRVFDRLTASISSRELQYSKERLGAVRLSINGRDSSATLDFAADLIGHRYSGAGTIDFTQRDAPVRLSVELRDVALGPIFDVFGNKSFSMPGTVAGELRVAGNLFGDRDPVRLEAEFSTLKFESNETRLAAQPPVLIKLQGNQIDFGHVHLSGTDTSLDIAGTLAIGEKGRTALTANGDINLRLLQNFVRELSAEGIVRVQIAASGDYRQPRLSGSATVENAALRSREFPVALTKGRGRLIFTSNQAQIASFTGDVGGGELSLTGGATLVGLVPDRWRVQARLNGVRIDYPQDFRTTADGELVLQGNRRLQLLSGMLNVRRAEYLAETDLFDLIERFMTEFGAGAVGTGEVSGIPPTQLDIRAVANDSLVISNKSLDLVASADLRFRGSLDDPIFGGRLTISRGLIDDLFKERYRITSGVIEFPGVGERPPRLSVEAETEISGYRLTVLIAGPFDNLRITPRSEPPLPQSDVIALMTSGSLPREGLIGGSPSQSLAQNQAGNLSTLLTQPLSSRIGSNVTGRLFGLNRFSIDPLSTGGGADPTARVTVGRRVTKDLSITYSTNLGSSSQDQVFLIEYRATDRLSFVASRAQDGAFGLDVRLRKRF